MTNRERILELIGSAPGLTDSEIRRRTGIEPHQQVNQICRSLATAGLIRRVKGPIGRIVNLPASGMPPGSSGSSQSRQQGPSVEPTVNLHQRRSVRSGELPFRELAERLFVVPCSGAKKPGGTAQKSVAVIDQLSASLARELSDRRALNAASASVDASALLPAVERYAGYFYGAGGPAIRALLVQGSTVLILSGGYGIVFPDEVIGMYNCEFRPKMWPDRVIERCLSSLAAASGVREVVGVLSATTGYAKVFRRTEWPVGVEKVHLVTPESVTGSMAKAPRAQGEALGTIAATGELPADWTSTDGLRMEVARLDQH